ncbi:9720_t:CDS:1, partial [Paraglomus occultum]
DLFPGAYDHDELLGMLVKTKKLQVHQIKEQFPFTMPTSKYSSDLNWEPESVVINGQSAQFADCFFTIKGASKENYLVCLQCKWHHGSENPITSYSKEIKEEHKRT